MRGEPGSRCSPPSSDLPNLALCYSEYSIRHRTQRRSRIGGKNVADVQGVHAGARPVLRHGPRGQDERALPSRVDTAASSRRAAGPERAQSSCPPEMDSATRPPSPSTATAGRSGRPDQREQRAGAWPSAPGEAPRHGSRSSGQSTASHIEGQNLATHIVASSCGKRRPYRHTQLPRGSSRDRRPASLYGTARRADGHDRHSRRPGADRRPVLVVRHHLAAPNPERADRPPAVTVRPTPSPRPRALTTPHPPSWLPESAARSPDRGGAPAFRPNLRPPRTASHALHDAV